MFMRRMLLAAGLAVASVGCLATDREGSVRGRGQASAAAGETDGAREARLARVAQRRGGVVVMVHRGASRFAPENTLEAYAAAMDLGADGCEIDIRRTKDGVLVLHHDDRLGRTVEGGEKVAELKYEELAARKLKGGGAGRVPTLAAALELARRRAMLLHLDIKEPGLEKEIAMLLDEADVWQHVVHINAYHSEELRKDPRLKLLRYKGWLHEAGTSEAQQAAFLKRPEEMIFVKDDPGAAVKLVGRGANAVR
jgi:hypothetical protein